MIANDGDDGRRAATEPGVLIEDRTDGLIGERDFPIVRPAGECFAKRRRRIVRVVRVVEMHPQEERPLVAADPVQPLARCTRRFIAAPLELAPRVRPHEAIVVGVESLGEAVPAVQYERADKRRRHVSTFVQHGGQRWHGRPQ